MQYSLGIIAVMSKNQADTGYSSDSYWSITLGDNAYDYAAELDPDQKYVMNRLLSIGRILLPQIGDYQLDYLMLQPVDDFFAWYSCRAADPRVTVLGFDLMEIVSGPKNWMTVTAFDSEAFVDLKSLIIEAFKKLKDEIPSLSIFRVEITVPSHKQDDGYGIIQARV